MKATTIKTNYSTGVVSVTTTLCGQPILFWTIGKKFYCFPWR